MELDLNSLNTLLQQPALYDHPVDKIQLEETHISLVILTGQFVYKIKKPVDYGFLDFSSLAKRKSYCEEEVRLNSRLAPDLYLGVVPICGNLNDAKINGVGPTIEYAVKMRQFDTQQEFDKLLSSNKLDQNIIDETAKVLADFHSNIAISNRNMPYGSSEVIHQYVQENFEQIDLLGKEWLAAHNLLPTLQNLREWIEKQNTNLETNFTTRKMNGFIRECHGDLHLRNIVLLEGRVTPFDGIEFNKNLSWIDVINDIAFLLMDLDDHGRYDLSRILLNEYLSFTGDYTGLAVLRYYKVYRAMVRAKVAGLRLLQLKNTSSKLVAEIENYLQISLDYIRPKKAKLIICHGLSGSGKTFISQRILGKSDIIRIRSDIERKRMIRSNTADENRTKINSGIYSKEASLKTYNHLLQLSDIILKSGYSVLVDAAFLEKEQRKLFFNYAQSNSIDFLILHCKTDVELQRQRLNKRISKGKDASDADASILEHQLKSQEPLEIQERKYSITIKNNDSPDLTQLIDWLEK